MELTRRTFMHGFAAAAGLAVAATPLDAFARLMPVTGKRFLMGAENELFSLALDDNAVMRIPLGFNTHGIFPHPTDKNRVWAVEKLGTNGAEVDLKTGKAVKHFKSPDNAFFYGHAAYQPESDTLFVACMRYNDRTGHLVGYDVRDYTITSDDYICSGPIHDVQFMPDGRLMAAVIETKWQNDTPLPVAASSIYGLKEWSLVSSGLAIFDPHTRERIMTKPVLDGNAQAVTHFHQLKSGGAIAIAAPWDRDGIGAFYFTPDAEKPLARVNCGAALEGKFKYEFLSIAVDEDERIAAVTNPVGSYVVFFNARTGKFIDAVKHHFTNVSFDPRGQRFIGADSGQVVTIGYNKLGAVLVDGLKGSQNGALPFNSAHSLII